ncbi:MAG TPA: LLM class flavin-dependent oxidoreductase [Ilumatobacteraceae bacterium]|nr:LLM class flavin-dependent oxidoreductase [Ilumatobacteraceae bacterium]
MSTVPTTAAAPGVSPGLPLSVLDLAMVVAGGSSHAALAATTQLAQAADRLGYTRFWVAEHHNMPSVACTSPTVLMAHLAAVTEHIRVGSGGVMLPNHAPLVVAEQFAMLEALHPDRIDIGIGRAPGTDPRTAAALRRSPEGLGAEDFPRELIDLMGLLGDPRRDEGLWTQFRATPVATSSPAVFLLGSSGYSAQVAGYLGLPFGYAHHFDMGGTEQAVALYRETFTPSPILDEPYLVITANVLAADTDELANWHADPGRLTMLRRRTGRFMPLPSPADAAAHPDLEMARGLPSNRIIGDAATCVAELRALAAATDANEMMITAVAYDLDVRIHSLELVAAAWGLTAR